MNRIFLSLGSNIDPERHLPACIKIITEKFCINKISSIFETSPVGPAGGGKFWNAVVGIESAVWGENLSKELKNIEASLGRVRNPADKFAPRTIDIDILPQPGYQQQAFIMIPLAEIAPDIQDEETGKTFSELAEKFQEEKKKYRKVTAG